MNPALFNCRNKVCAVKKETEKNRKSMLKIRKIPCEKLGFSF